ncbi:MAG: transketolase, partial [Patescibacteria group bacterium]
METKELEKIAKFVRSSVLKMCTQAGSGHPTSALSAVELMVGLMFGGVFRFDLKNPALRNNDRLIFSKGHAAPLLYSLYAAAGRLSKKDLLSFRKFGSELEGHPTVAFPYAEAATGSLGQGLSVGVGMALAGKYLDKLPYKTFVLLGDGEMAEGSVWEALELASHYKLDNLIGIIDVNRLGQCGETMHGWNLEAYEKRISAFGWEVIKVKDGHNFEEVQSAFERATARGGTDSEKSKPTMIIAKTVKGKGVSFLENHEGWHGRALNSEELKSALKELGDADEAVNAKISAPPKLNQPSVFKSKNFMTPLKVDYASSEPVATRKA